MEKDIHISTEQIKDLLRKMNKDYYGTVGGRQYTTFDEAFDLLWSYLPERDKQQLEKEWERD